MKLFAYAILIFNLQISCLALSGNSLKSVFADPMDKVKTSVYWYWISGNVSEEGVKKDLHAMKKAGIDRAFIGCMGVDGVVTPYEKVKFGSPKWWRILHSALKTATELDIEIGIFNTPGWSQSGGPWVKPSQAMRYLASSSYELEGGGKISLNLRRESADFQDVKVLAFPMISKGNSLNSGEIDFPKDEKKPYEFFFKSDKDFTLRSVLFYPSQKGINTRARLFVKDGDNYRKLGEYSIDRFNFALNVGFSPYAPVVISIPGVRGREFKVEFDSSAGGSGLKDIVLSSKARIERYPEKSLAKMFQSPLPYWNEYQWPAQAPLDAGAEYISSKDVLDISSCLNGDKLEWEAPPGKWLVMRMGMLPTGVTNTPADPEATGLEVDKMSRAHVEAHFEAYMGEIIRRIPAEDRKSWKLVVQDSYETGGQNFTDDFIDSFKSRYGYDPLPFLPVYQGYIVDSPDRSNRFLWDLRRLVADRVAYDYVGGLRDISHKYGLRTWLENYGHWGFPGEFLQYGGQSDEIGGEFWSFGNLGNIENRAASSCGHIYGKRLIYAESFTSAARPFSCYPGQMKARGDRFFAEGINSSLLHLCISQVSDSELPGINAWFNSEFNRLNTWFSHMDLFSAYLKRANLMLQQGINVADVAYFIGEDAPKMTGIAQPALPKGYQFDYINAEVIERDLFVRNGLLTLPHGTQYKILVLPKLKTMRPELLKKLNTLLNDGAVILGPAPERSPSGKDYGLADVKVKELADSMWKGLDGKNVKYVRRGKGMLMLGLDMQEALDIIACRPDCKLPADLPVLYAHRTANDMEIYFLTNQSAKSIDLNPEFRVKGKRPEWWEPTTGKVRALPAFSHTEFGTAVPMRLEPFESAFIVFKDSATLLPGGSSADNCPKAETCLSLDKDWKVTFKDSLRGPKESQTFPKLIDISTHTDDLIRYYSGTLIYEKEIELKDLPDGEIYLNLGYVGVMAKVSVNGDYAGGVWTAPYRVDVSNKLRKGKNLISVEVTTTWQNRLIGDSALSKDKRTTWAACNNWRKNDALQKSGLLGPVVLESIKKIEP